MTTGTIPQLQLSLNQENRALVKAEKDLENAYLQIVGSDFQTYISNITDAEDAVELAKEAVEEIKSEIESKKVQIEKFKSLLTRLGA